MKIHIHYPITNAAFGGGNQFLKALKSSFKALGLYEENLNLADVILFNSFDQADSLVQLKRRFRNKTFVHRVDGPIRLYNTFTDNRDQVVNTLNEFIADSTVFQSQWSKKQNHSLSMKTKQFEAVIMNAPDPILFCKRDALSTHSTLAKPKDKKLKIIATSWSDNIKKGFSTYQWLDEHLDFSKFEMVFIGRSPKPFKAIKTMSPLPSVELAAQLRASDIYLTASENDPCSNSLLEAIHSGLPAVARNSGGHPEIVKNSGLLFNSVEEIPRLLEKIAEDYEVYTRTSLPNLDEVTRQYVNFFEVCVKEHPTHRQIFLPPNLIKAQTRLFKIKIQDRLRRYARKLFN